MRKKNQVRIARVTAVTVEIGHALQSLHFSNFRPAATEWEPRLNAYYQGDSIDLCFDLAGIEQEQIEIVIEPNRVTIRGSRSVPRPPSDAQSDVRRQILLMEIESGAFTRTVDLPHRIDPEQSVARQESGFLWLNLKLDINAS